MRFKLYLDTVLIPPSLFLMVAYHVYLWYSFNNRSSSTQIGLHVLKRKLWLLEIKEGGGSGKKGMLAAQSLRNTQMATMFTATTSILLNVALASLTNNAYNASHPFRSQLLGTQSAKIYALKYGLASLVLLASFFSSSAALWYMIDANFLINSCGEFSDSPTYTEMVVERGFMLAITGNRMLCVSFPLLLWMFGPLPVAFASGALVWGLYQLDFVGKQL